MTSVDLDTERFEQRAPMLEIALNELADVLRREVEALEAVIAEELRGLGMIKRLGNVGVNLGKKIGRHFSRPPQPEPDRCFEARNRLGNGRQIRQVRDPPLVARRDHPPLSALRPLLPAPPTS